MRNIKFTKEDHMKDLADILQEPPIEGVHFVQQINTFRYTGVFGLISIALFIFAMFMSAKWRMNEIGLHAEADLIFAIEFFIAFAFMQYLILPIVHEFIHAFAYPRHAEKKIYIRNAHTYCEAKMGKCRYILMLLLPFFLLSILPFAPLMLLMPLLPGREVGMILMLILYSVFSCLLDMGSSWVILLFVPAKAKVFVRGKYLYWEE